MRTHLKRRIQDIYSLRYKRFINWWSTGSTRIETWSFRIFLQLFDTGWEDESCWRMLEKLWCRVVELLELSWLLVPRSDADRDCWHCSFLLILIHCLVVQEDIFLALEWSFSSLLTWLWNREPIVFFRCQWLLRYIKWSKIDKRLPKNTVTFYT